MSAEKDLLNANVKVAAAGLVRDGRIQEFEASLLVGSDAERQEAQNAVMAATEAWLDAKQESAFHFLRTQGINPEYRGRPYA